METGVGDGELYRLGGSYIDKVGSCGNCFRPVGGRHGGLKQERTSDIIDRADRALSLSVLGGCVWAREAKADPVRGKEGGDGGVDELSSVIGLHSDDGAGELCACIGDKGDEMIGSVRLAAQWKSPHKMRKIINNDKIVLQTRIA